MSHDIDTLKVGSLTIHIKPDLDAESPRDWDHLGTMVCWHRRHKLGDEHAFRDPSEFRLAHDERTAVILPLYLYDHSGITMNTTGFDCPWDSGQVGYIYVSLEEVRLEYDMKRVTKRLREQVKDRLRQEVRTYDQWLTGGFCGFTIEDEDGEHVDSCWGFDDLDYCRQEARMIAEHHMKEIAGAEMAEVL